MHLRNIGVEETLSKSQHTKLTLEKQILWLHLPGFELTAFWSQAWRSYQQAIPEHYTLHQITIIVYALL